MGTVATIHSIAPMGFDGCLIEVECDTTRGLPSFQVVGLANKSIDEAKERVKSAITNSLLEFPTKRITVNLAPAKIPKDGTHYDLPIALAILVSSGQIKQNEIHKSMFAGELALDGTLRPITCAITAAEIAKRSGLKQIYLPIENAPQAALIEGIDIIPIKNLRELYLHIKKELVLSQQNIIHKHTGKEIQTSDYYLDQIVGQEQAKRGLIIAAAGGHNILLSGPPGAGKTMLGKVLPELLPPLSKSEKLAITKLHNMHMSTIDSLVDRRPFRTPHHTTSRTSLIGGGTFPKPGEISLAHHGVLFLDEMPEYPRSILESLRQPLEDKNITITRANGVAQYPCDFLLMGTMNPCPCGYYGDSTKECSCSLTQIQLYQKKLSGPLLDRIDLKISVNRVPHRDLLEQKVVSKIQHNNALSLINKARKIQHQRYKSCTKYNSNVSNGDVQKFFSIEKSAKEILLRAAEKLELSARSTFKTMKVAQTIADLDDGTSNIITAKHITEALQYR